MDLYFKKCRSYMSKLAGERCEILNHSLKEIIKLQNLYTYPYFS